MQRGLLVVPGVHKDLGPLQPTTHSCRLYVKLKYKLGRKTICALFTHSWAELLYVKLKPNNLFGCPRPHRGDLFARICPINRLLAEIDCQCARSIKGGRRRSCFKSRARASFAEGWVEGGFRQTGGWAAWKKTGCVKASPRWTIYLHLSLVANTEPSGQTVEQLEAQMTFIYISRERASKRTPARSPRVRTQTRYDWQGQKVFPFRRRRLPHTHTHPGNDNAWEREQNDLCGGWWKLAFWGKKLIVFC